jgi:hypothetical protein
MGAGIGGVNQFHGLDRGRLMFGKCMKSRPKSMQIPGLKRNTECTSNVVSPPVKGLLRPISMKLFASLIIACTSIVSVASPVAPCKITWTTPSQDSVDSMPLSGRLGAGANVWVQDGAIWLYLAHNGAYDEHGRLLKLGCLRLAINGVRLGEPGFTQELDPATGTITIRQGEFAAALWFAGETLVYEASTPEPRALEVAFGTWRERTKDGIRNDMMGAKTTFTADHVKASPGGFVWFHRNGEFPQDLAGKANGQGIDPAALPDVTARRVSGAAVCVDGGMSQPAATAVRWQFWNGKAWTGMTQPRTNHLVTMRLVAAVDADPANWPAEAKSMLDETVRGAAKAEELRRWREFWSRSHIVINPQATDSGFLIGRNYQLFRYMLACNRDGEFPLLFNGGIFTTDNNGRIKGNNNDELPTFEGEPVTPDFRRWMGCYFMSQNQRWLGWPTVASGDADLLAPTTRFYRDRAKVAADRARKNGADGVVYTEPLDVWGLCPVGPRPDGLCGATHLTYHFSMGLENAWMNLQAHDTMGISLEKDLPWILGTVFFYDSFYRAETKKRTGKDLGADGKLVIYPGNGLEFAGDATDPLDAVCGLHAVTEGLLRYPKLAAADRQRVERIHHALPPLPLGKRRGVRSLLPAKHWRTDYNKWEPIEMYAAWPYRLVGITRPDTLQLARDSWETIPDDRARLCKQDYSWMANLANMAALAWPDLAKERAIYKMANTTSPQARFPAFFGPGHDWLPDHNWGGAGMTGIQEMILAPEPGPNGKLHLFPAWPADWDVDFKLHAPGQTVVEAVLKGGKLESLKVTPPSRAKDIVNWLGKQPVYTPIPPPPVPLSQGKKITASSQFNEPGYNVERANDGDLKTRWASDYGARSGWLEIDLGEEKEIGRVWLSEVEWPETQEFAIEVLAGGTWQQVARGTTIGADKEITFAPVKARQVRLNIVKAKLAININEFQVFPP